MQPAHDKRLEETRQDMYEVLKELLNVYYRNMNSSGKCPHPKEFIATISPEGIPLHWKKAKMFVEYIEGY